MIEARQVVITMLPPGLAYLLSFYVVFTLLCLSQHAILLHTTLYNKKSPLLYLERLKVKITCIKF